MTANGAVILRQAQVGAPYISQNVSYNFGSIIPPPLVDYTGAVLTNVANTAYWRSIPLLTLNNQFYYSTNAGVVFATQPGQISVTWITTAEWNATNRPGYTNQLGANYGVPSLINNPDGTVSPLYTASYLISPTPAKPVQHIYWTEGVFETLSHPVVVPVGQISGINPVFNTGFPALVTNSYGVVSPGLTNYQTLWYDTGTHTIRANSQEGLVFVELLGQPNGENSSEFLGFEIVQVAKAPSPSYVTNYLGMPLTAYQDPTLGTELTLAPIPNVGSQFYYNYGTTYYADRATTNVTDLQMYWLDTGVAGLQWPFLFNRYALVWPSDPAQYGYYLRPAVTNPAQAALTAVQLDPFETPSLDYYDPLDQPRAWRSPTYGFYTWLTNGYPAIRALLRFNADGNVRFERVFSYLAQGLQNNQLLAGSVATNLSAWNPTNSTLTNYASSYNPPYVLNATVNVGDQIPDPPGELGSSNAYYGDFWAGYINTNVSASLINTNIGTSYDPAAYLDPFAYGFGAANAGAIIPVNAIPGKNHLEVWWFREDSADPADGFEPVYLALRDRGLYNSMAGQSDQHNRAGRQRRQRSAWTACMPAAAFITRMTPRSPATIPMRNTRSCWGARPTRCGMTSTSPMAPTIPPHPMCWWLIMDRTAGPP